MMTHDTPTFANDSNALPLWLTTPETLEATLTQLPSSVSDWVSANDFGAGAGAVLVIPGADGEISGALGGMGGAKTASRRRFTLAAIAKSLPRANWKIETDLDPDDAEEAALGWLLAAYHFSRYNDGSGAGAKLVAPKGVDAKRLEIIAAGEFLTRDLINTPTSDMGPDALEAEFSALAKCHGAKVNVTKGQDLLDENFPMIHAVGRAAAEQPRLLEMNWGNTGPKVTLVGKGVCFDTGGLNLKPGNSMALMKKDMGGAANVMGLAHMIMASGQDVQLRVLIPAVENSVSANSFRPGDILTARNGMTVEINNTDAEGRLVLADALSLAAEGDQDILISMATLTGAARVAVGPDLAPFYCDDDQSAANMMAAGARVRDPLWRMPFWDPYESMIEPGIADLDNAPSGGFAGSITAALFLRRFAGTNRYAHFDIYGWQPSAAPGRPKGGACQASRALFDALPDLIGV